VLFWARPAALGWRQGPPVSAYSPTGPIRKALGDAAMTENFPPPRVDHPTLCAFAGCDSWLKVLAMSGIRCPRLLMALNGTAWNASRMVIPEPIDFRQREFRRRRAVCFGLPIEIETAGTYRRFALRPRGALMAMPRARFVRRWLVIDHGPPGHPISRLLNIPQTSISPQIPVYKSAARIASSRLRASRHAQQGLATVAMCHSARPSRLIRPPLRRKYWRKRRSALVCLTVRM